MSTQISEVISNLCKTLKINTEEAIDYVGTLIPKTATYHIISNIFYIVTFFIATFIMYKWYLRAYRKCKHELLISNSQAHILTMFFDIKMHPKKLLFMLGSLVILIIISFILLLVKIPDTVGWITAPQIKFYLKYLSNIY